MPPKHKIKASHMPGLVHDMAKWLETAAVSLYPMMEFSGTKFYYPKGVTTTRGVAKYHAQTLRDNPYLMFVGKDITYLAAKSVMSEFRLDASAFPSKTGVILWETPIGSAESAGNMTAGYDPKSGKIVGFSWSEDALGAYKNAETPVNMVTWRVSSDESEVLICLHSDGDKARVGFRNASRKMAERGTPMPSDYFDMRDSDPSPLEREQVLPLGKTLGWLESYGSDSPNILKQTITIDPEKLRLAEKSGHKKEYIEAHDEYIPTLNHMLKTFVSTLMIRKMKVASTEEVEATPSVKKKMAKAGAPSAATDRKVCVVRIGRLKRATTKKTKEGGKGTPWGVKTFVGPKWRSRQYIPATGEYRENTEEEGWIEPYVAGPEDAPWSESARVYLLD